MTPTDVAIVLFIGFAIIDFIATIVLARRSHLFPHIRSLRERRNVSLAITSEVSFVCLLALNTRVFHVDINRDWQTSLLIIALSLPSLVNIVWLRRALQPVPATLQAEVFKDDLLDDSVRSELRHAMVNMATSDLGQYYLEHPEWGEDDRHDAAVYAMRKGLRKMLALLDDYDITKK